MIVSIASAALSYVLYSVLGKAFGVMGIATALTAVNLLVATSYMLLSKRYIKRAEGKIAYTMPCKEEEGDSQMIQKQINDGKE